MEFYKNFERDSVCSDSLFADFDDDSCGDGYYDDGDVGGTGEWMNLRSDYLSKTKDSLKNDEIL